MTVFSQSEGAWKTMTLFKSLADLQIPVSSLEDLCIRVLQEENLVTENVASDLLRIEKVYRSGIVRPYFLRAIYKARTLDRKIPIIVFGSFENGRDESVYAYRGDITDRCLDTVIHDACFFGLGYGETLKADKGVDIRVSNNSGVVNHNVYDTADYIARVLCDLIYRIETDCTGLFVTGDSLRTRSRYGEVANVNQVGQSYLDSTKIRVAIQNLIAADEKNDIEDRHFIQITGIDDFADGWDLKINDVFYRYSNINRV